MDILVFFQNKEIFVQLDKLDEVDRITHESYPEIFPLSALIACNAMNWPEGTAIYFSHKFHHWLMLYTFGQYIVNVRWSMTGDGFLTIFKFGIRNRILSLIPCQGSEFDEKFTDLTWNKDFILFFYCLKIPAIWLANDQVS